MSLTDRNGEQYHCGSIHWMMCQSRATPAQLADHSWWPQIYRPVDKIPGTFAEMKPPGYYSEKLGCFVEVRMISDAEAAERQTERADW